MNIAFDSDNNSHLVAAKISNNSMFTLRVITTHCAKVSVDYISASKVYDNRYVFALYRAAKH